jgi:prolycopene isomerase
LAPPGGQIIIVQKVTKVDYDNIDDWPAHKAAIEDFILTSLETCLPGVSSKIVVKLSASAQTSNRYTLNHHGAMLGWEMAPDQLGERRPAIQSPFNNLHFVGHWAQPGGGITPVMISAMQAVKLITQSTEAHSRPVPAFTDVAAAVPA